MEGDSLGIGGRLAHYRLDALLGRGGMGVVYLAHDLRLDRRVALKVIRPEAADPDGAFRERFLRESRLAARLDHAHVVPVFEAGEGDGGMLYLAMRYVEGCDLRQALLQEGALEAERVVLLTQHVASALDAAHRSGIVHRDVKPSNILLTGSGADEHAYVADFGLTKEIASQTLSSAGDFLGTLAYAAPEQIRGADVDGRADVYALGCVVYQCLTGAVPFDGSEAEVLWGHLDAKPPPLEANTPGLAALDEVIERALAKHPEDRYSTAGELAGDLAAAVARIRGPGVASPPRVPVGGEPIVALPSPVTALVGRQGDVERLVALISDPSVRLLTLTGAGGSGKTRLALEIAWSVTAEFLDGVAFVELAPIEDPQLVPAAIAGVLELQEFERQTMLDVVSSFLRQRKFLLILDNFEHLADAWDAVAHLLRACPRLTILTTSRSPLHLSGETEYAVDPLDLDTALELLVARLRLTPSGGWDDEEQASARELCRRLDCLPLAIELAAARSRLLTPSQLLARLGTVLGSLHHGARDLPARQQTLQATLDWSYHLLDEDQKLALHELSAFAGGCTIEAAGDVLSARDGLMVIEGLIDASLIRQAADGAEARLEMLETVREYAAQKGDVEAAGPVRDRHARHYCALASHAAAELHGPEQVGWFDRLDREHPNLRAALGWLLSTGDPAAAELAANLWWFWYVRGHWTEGRQWLEQAVAAAGDADPARARALVGAGVIAREQGELGAAEELLTEAASASADPHTQGLALNELAGVAFYEGDSDRAERVLREGISLLERSGNRTRRGEVLGNLGLILSLAGESEDAIRTFQDALHEVGQSGDVFAATLVRFNLAEVLAAHGQIDVARQHALEALASVDRLGSRRIDCMVNDNLAFSAVLQGDLVGARRYLRQAFEATGGTQGHSALAGLVRTAGLIARLEGSGPLAVRLLSAASRFTYLESAAPSKALEELRHGLEPDEYARLVHEGEAMSLDEAVATAAHVAGLTSNVHAEASALPSTAASASRNPARLG